MNNNHRIRYTETQNSGVLQSKNVFHHPSNGARYRILLDENQGLWRVLDDKSGMEAATGVNGHPHKLRIAAREALLSLGVPLTVETRDRKVKTNLV